MNNSLFFAKLDLFIRAKETPIEEIKINSINNYFAKKKGVLPGTPVKRIGKVTSPEKKMAKLLKELNISFKKEYPIIMFRECKFYDFYLPEYNILIEVDGDYFHGNQERVAINFMSKRNKKNDKMKDVIAHKNNMQIIRFWENDIEHHEENVRDDLLYFIKRNKQTV